MTDASAPLHHVRLGAPDGDRVVLLHGFTQNVDCWGSFAEDLARDHEVVLIDAPGHGGSNFDDATLWESADLILATIGPEPAHLVGYSMGGRIALHAALVEAGSRRTGGGGARLRSLTLVGATAGIRDAVERRARREADEVLAQRLLDDGVDAFLDGWLASPLFAALDDVAAARDARLRNRAEGLSASLRSVGTGSQESLWDRLLEVDLPTLVIAGTRDQKFTELGRQLEAGIGEGRFVGVEGGHAIHLEEPVAVAARVRDFLRSLR